MTVALRHELAQGIGLQRGGHDGEHGSTSRLLGQDQGIGNEAGLAQHVAPPVVPEPGG